MGYRCRRRMVNPPFAASRQFIGHAHLCRFSFQGPGRLRPEDCQQYDNLGGLSRCLSSPITAEYVRFARRTAHAERFAGRGPYLSLPTVRTDSPTPSGRALSGHRRWSRCLLSASSSLHPIVVPYLGLLECASNQNGSRCSGGAFSWALCRAWLATGSEPCACQPQEQVCLAGW